MAPTELVFEPKSRPRWRAHIVSGLVFAVVNLPTVVCAQDEPPEQPAEVAQEEPVAEEKPVEPTVGEAVATERAPDQARAEPDRPNGDPTAQAPRAPAASSTHSMLDAVRAAAARQLIPAPSPEELRQRTLDTSFPAEQPHLDVTESPREVVAVPVGPIGPREPSRRTVVRVIDGVTVLTNVTDGADEDNAVRPSVAPPRPAANVGQEARQAQAELAMTPREVAVNSNALSPASKSGNSTGLGVWLWALAGFAVLLLVPIGVLLTRPVRRG